MKKFLALIVASIVLMTAHVLAANYVGNASSKKFHYANCTYAQKIKASNRVEFSSREEAINNGYIPCKKCSP